MWRPEVDRNRGGVSRQVLERLQADIEDGRLEPGVRLPPQRMLAHALGISVGAVTQAYDEATRRGLVRPHVGRGTFVAGKPESDGAFALATAPSLGVVDVARNRPPPGPAARRLRQALEAVARGTDAEALLDYAPPNGFERERRLIGRWLAELSSAPLDDPARLILCGGAQQAMAIALFAVARPGETVLCEDRTFQGMKALADHMGCRLQGVPMDGEGLLPDRLDEALRSGAAKVLYTMPTLQNPTARTMGLERRREIAEVCRRHEAWIIEDDLYGGYADPSPDRVPIARIAPERTFHVAGGSKILAPGLRVGALTPPGPAMAERALRAVRAMNYAPSAFGARIMAEWVEDGTANLIRADLRREMGARTALAADILGEAMEPPSSRTTPHVWLSMSELDAERVAGRALRAGVEVTPPSAPLAPGAASPGLRICLGAPAERADLERALHIVRAALTSEVGDRSLSVV